MTFPKVIQYNSQVFHRLHQRINWVKSEFSTNPQRLLVLLLFYLLLLFFPTNLAIHFSSSQSYVLGVFVGFLEPAIYLSEIIVLFLLLLSKWERVKNRKFLVLIILFLVSLLPSVFIGSIRSIAFFRFLEITLWLSFAFWIAEKVSWGNKDKIFKFLGLGVVWVSVLSLLQFIFQRNIFGYWFLGEPLLSPSLPNIASASFFGREVIRSYGTFPHPNVLGGVLSVFLVWFLFSKLWKFSLFGLVGTLVSFSRTAFLSLFLGVLGIFATKSFGLFLFNYQNFLNTYSISRRLELLEKAWEIFKSAPLFGVGIGHFTKALSAFGVPSDITLVIQPVHNIFALVASESGVFALIFLLALLIYSFYKTVKTRRFLLTISLLQLVFLGFFDHYLYTLPQGLFLLALVLGLSFSSSQD